MPCSYWKKQNYFVKNRFFYEKYFFYLARATNKWFLNFNVSSMCSQSCSDFITIFVLILSFSSRKNCLLASMWSYGKLFSSRLNVCARFVHHHNIRMRSIIKTTSSYDISSANKYKTHKSFIMLCNHQR